MATDPIYLAVMLAGLALLPTLVVVTTCFLKIAIVLNLVRNAIGVQQIPPNIAMYGLALLLSVYVMAPVGQQIYERVAGLPVAERSVENLVKTVRQGAEPLRGFLKKHSSQGNRGFFTETARQLWGPQLSESLTDQDFLVLMPSFLLTEMTEAFRIGFLLYLPFVVIDLVVSNILLAMGMMMLSPVTISLPLKLFLFVMVDGWTRLIKALVMTYV